jgi:CAAX protease family protein
MTAGADRGHRFAIAPDWRGRGLALLRVLIFLALCLGASYGANAWLDFLHKHIHTIEGHWLLSMSVIGLAVTILTYVAARLTGWPFGALGYAGPNAARNFALGIACGLGLIAAQLGLLTLLGFVAWQAPANGAGLHFAAFYALLFLVVAFTEETLFRGYTLVELSRAVSFWPAALILAAFFGALHVLKGGGENLIGGAQAAAFALILAWTFRRTGSLWFAIGLHAGWDYAQSFLFGVADSGTVLEGSLLHPVLNGPEWITGGGVGPEGSALFVFSTLALAGIALLLPPQQERI